LLAQALERVRIKYRNAEADPNAIQELLNALYKYRRVIEDFELPSGIGSQFSQLPSPIRKALRPLQKLKGRASFPLDTQVLSPKENDPTGRKFRKTVSRIKLNLLLKARWIKNLVLFRKKASLDFTRQFRISGLVRHYVAVPTEQLLLNEWLFFNRAAADLFKATTREFSKSARPSEGNPNDFMETMQAAREGYRNAQKSDMQRLVKELQTSRNNTLADWKFAGTFALPYKNIGAKSYAAKHKKHMRKFMTYRGAWEKFWRGKQKDSLKDVDILILTAKARQKFHQTKSEVRLWHEQFIENKMISLKEKIEEFRQDSQKKGRNNSHLQQFLKAKSTQLFVKEIENRALEPVDALQTFKLSKMLLDYKETIKQIVDDLEDSYSVFRSSEKNQLVPQSDLIPFSMKQLIEFYTQAEFDTALKLLSDSARNDILTLSDELNTISDVIQGGLDTAYMLLRRDGSGNKNESDAHSPLNVLLEGLDRAEDKLTYIIEQVGSLENNSFTQLEEKYQSFVTRMDALIESNKILQVRLTLMKARAHGGIRDFLKIVGKKALRQFRIARYVMVPIFRKGWRALSRIMRIITVKARLKEEPHGSGESINAYLRKTKNAIDGLPAVYQRLFNFSPLENDKFMVSREKELNKIENSFKGWRQGQTGMAALVGERGSGRSTLINLAMSGFFKDENVKKIQSVNSLTNFDDMRIFLEQAFDVKPGKSMGELEDRISELENDRVIILEDFHRLFLKTAMGLRIFSRLLLFAARTQHNTFWLISCDNYAWLYLDKVLNLRRFFAGIIQLPGLTNEEIEKVITVRHRISGIPLEFTESEEISTSRKYKLLHRQTQRKELTRKRFFKNLHTSSGGNVSVAMVLWLTAIENQENKNFKLAENFTANPRMLNSLIDSELFVITAIIQHEALSVEQLSQLLNVPRDAALLLLTGLHNRHIIEIDGEQYKLHFFLYRPMTQLLYDKRFLHYRVLCIKS